MKGAVSLMLRIFLLISIFMPVEPTVAPVRWLFRKITKFNQFSQITRTPVTLTVNTTRSIKAPTVGPFILCTLILYDFRVLELQNRGPLYKISFTRNLILQKIFLNFILRYGSMIQKSS